jgi:hypothetical protein
MANATVLSLYMTTPDLMRSGYRQKVDYFECDPNGIIGDKSYESETPLILLVSKKSYDIIEEAELVLDKGVLMENIYVDADLYHLKPGSIIEIGEMLFEVTGPCESYGYLYGFAPELPELIAGKRGLFVKPLEFGTVNVGDEVTIEKEA